MVAPLERSTLRQHQIGGVGESSAMRSGKLVLGVMVRTLGAFPSGWRVDGAHKNPATDPQALKRLAREAERAHLDYLFFGDWLSTSVDLEFTDPYLLSRIDPVSAVGFLASVTNRIGLIATVNTGTTEPYAVARTAASLDAVSGGRVALNLTVGTDPRAEANFGGSRHQSVNGYDVATEYVDILRGLWDTWADDAFVRKPQLGALIDRSRVVALDHVGRSFQVAGPLNAPRPVQGHVPVVHAGASPRAREFGAAHADLHVAASSSLREAVSLYHDVKSRAEAAGRDPATITVVAPILPIVAETREDAWAVYDRLVALLPVDDGSRESASLDLPPQRTAFALRQLIGVPLLDRQLDNAVSHTDAERFNAVGRRLLQTVADRSGRTVGGERPVSYRHLLAVHLVPAPIIVGSPTDIADYFEEWFRAGAVDGFHVQSAYLHEQFEAFTRLVVPELRARGLFRSEYTSKTLREHLGSPRPEWQPHQDPSAFSHVAGAVSPT